MSTGTGALQTTYPGQKRADKRTFNRRILLKKKDRNRTMKMTDFARVFRPIPLRLNYRLISTIQYLQRLFIHKKITPACLACLCFTDGEICTMKRIVQNFSQFPGSSGNKRKNLGTKIDHIDGEHPGFRIAMIYRFSQA